MSNIRFLAESESAALIDEDLAFDAVRAAFVAAVSGEAVVFPAVDGHGADPANGFTVKSAATAALSGVKIGSYWPGNTERGLPCHSSTVLLIDEETGRIAAVVEAGVVNAYRTAAADAVAATVLARPDATTLAVFGTGHQALYECVAVSRVRPIGTVLVAGRTPARTDEFVRRLADRGLAGTAATPHEACASADVIITATPATAPLFDAAWVRPGTHIATMGSDAPGAQELPPALLHRARLFCDLPAQSVRIGEFQHIAAEVENGTLTLTAIGDVLTGRTEGRRTAEEITVFDSSGIALQDLFVAEAVLRRADA